MGGSFGRGKRGAGPGAFQNSDRPAGRGEGAARSHCGGRGRVTAAFRSGGVRGCSRLLLVCLLPLALRRAAGLEVGGRPGAASPFRGRLSGAAAAAAGACLVGTRLDFPPPRRGVIPKRWPGLYWFLVDRKTPHLFWRARLGWHEGSSRTMPSIRAPASKQTATLQVRHHYHSPVDGLAPGKLHSRCLTASIAHRVRNCNRDDAFRLQVAVKCRPLTDTEQRRSRHIIQVIDDKVPPRCASGVSMDLLFAIGGDNVTVYTLFAHRLWSCWTLICQRIIWTSSRTGPRKGAIPSIMCTRLGAPIRYVIVKFALLSSVIASPAFDIGFSSST